MSRYNTYYYLLFVLLIMGAFASMAQNDYGITILGLVALAFAVIFLIQLLWHFKQKRTGDLMVQLELISLITLSSILSMRVFYIRFPFVEIIFGLAGLILIVTYLIKLINQWPVLFSSSGYLALAVGLFFTAIILYTLSMTLIPFVPGLAEPSGSAAFACVLGFLIIGFWKKPLLVEGEKQTAFQFVFRLKDRSVVLVALFLLFTAYMGLTKINVLPRMYSDEFPQAYFELVNQAESGNANSGSGEYNHEEFKRQYDRFVNRHIGQDGK